MELLKLYFNRMLQVFSPQKTGQMVIAMAAGSDSQAIDVSGVFALSFSAAFPVEYTLSSAFDAQHCFSAQERTIGIRADVTHITFHSDVEVTIYVELM